MAVCSFSPLLLGHCTGRGDPSPRLGERGKGRAQMIEGIGIVLFQDAGDLLGIAHIYGLVGICCKDSFGKRVLCLAATMFPYPYFVHSTGTNSAPVWPAMHTTSMSSYPFRYLPCTCFRFSGFIVLCYPQQFSVQQHPDQINSFPTCRLLFIETFSIAGELRGSAFS